MRHSRCGTPSSARFASIGSGSVSEPGFRMPAGSHSRRKAANASSMRGEYISGSSCGPGPAVAVLAGERAAVPHDQPRGVGREPAEHVAALLACAGRR